MLRQAPQATSLDERIHQLPFGSERMALPTDMAKTCYDDVVVWIAVEDFADHDNATARHDVGRWFQGRQRPVDGIMNPLAHDSMELVGASAEVAKQECIVVAEIIELRMGDGKRRAHGREFFGVPHAPDFRGVDDSGMGAPVPRTEPGLGRPAGISDRHRIGARAAETKGTAIVKADDEVGSVDDFRSSFSDLAIADDHNSSAHCSKPCCKPTAFTVSVSKMCPRCPARFHLHSKEGLVCNGLLKDGSLRS